MSGQTSHRHAVRTVYGCEPGMQAGVETDCGVAYVPQQQTTSRLNDPVRIQIQHLLSVVRMQDITEPKDRTEFEQVFPVVVPSVDLWATDFHVGQKQPSDCKANNEGRSARCTPFRKGIPCKAPIQPGGHIRQVSSFTGTGSTTGVNAWTCHTASQTNRIELERI